MPPLTGRPWRRLRHHILTTRPAICAQCGQPIDLTLSGFHDYGPTVDHVEPRARGGTDHPTNLQPMHRICNLRKGSRPTDTPHSRNW